MEGVDLVFHAVGKAVLVKFLLEQVEIGLCTRAVVEFLCLGEIHEILPVSVAHRPVLRNTFMLLDELDGVVLDDR